MHPTIEATADGSGTIGYPTNSSAELVVALGEDGSRRGLAQMNVQDGGTRHGIRVSIPRGRPYCARVRASARGLEAGWPGWDEDVEGVLMLE